MLAQDASQLFGDDLVFAGLQHERTHGQPGPAFAAADHDRGLGVPQQLRNLLRLSEILGSHVICMWGT